MSENLYTSYFSTVSTDRKSPSKKKTALQEPPKKLSRSFTRQLAKTLGTTSKKRKGKGKASLKSKRKASATVKKMSKRGAPESSSAPESKKAKAALPEKDTDKEGQPFWEISGKRRLQLSDFKGTTMVGIREYYEKDGEALPGKKGISMTVEQFNTIVELLPQIEKELNEKGLELARPNYDGDGVNGDGKTGEGAEDDEDVHDGKDEEDGAADDEIKEEEA